MASPHMVETIERAFGVPAAMEYGSVECGFLAGEYPDRLLRVREDCALIETLPRSDGRYDIAVTVLGNASFPLLRYLIGDTTDVPLLTPRRGLLGASPSFRPGKRCPGEPVGRAHSRRVDSPHHRERPRRQAISGSATIRRTGPPSRGNQHERGRLGFRRPQAASRERGGLPGRGEAGCRAATSGQRQASPGGVRSCRLDCGLRDHGASAHSAVDARAAARRCSIRASSASPVSPRPWRSVGWLVRRSLRCTRSR